MSKRTCRDMISEVYEPYLTCCKACKHKDGPECTVGKKPVLILSEILGCDKLETVGYKAIDDRYPEAKQAADDAWAEYIRNRNNG